MGGKPYTSKGCVDCRRRKIKCDEQRPECGRCLKSGIQCQGWEKHRNFVGAGSISEAKKQQKINNPEPNGGSPCSDMTRTSSAAPPNPEMPIVVHSALTKAPTMRAQVFAAFIQNYFSSGSISSTTYFDDSIFYSIGGLVQRSQVTERALSAMSCIFLGKVNHNPSMFNHGVYLYQTAIQNISNMLRRGIYTHDLFYTVYLCQEIDIIHRPGGLASAAAHVSGMNTLLQHYKKAKSSRDPILETIYHHSQKLRIIIATTGMGLSKSEYDYIMEPTNGNPLLKIFQTTVAIGDLKYSIESIDPESPEPIPYEAMLQKAYEIQGILMELYHDGQLGKEPHRSAERRSDNMGIFPPELLFGYAYDFSSPNHALLFIMFWTNLVLLQPLVRRADSLFRLHTHAAGMRISPYPKFEDLARVDPEKYANKLARAMVYCLQDHIKLSLGKVMVFTLCIMSLNYVDTGNRVKHDWCLAGIMDIGFRGFDLPPYLTKLMSAQWDRRWTAGDPNITVSLREIDYSVCVLDPETVPDSTSGMEDGSMYHINDPRPVKEIFD